MKWKGFAVKTLVYLTFIVGVIGLVFCVAYRVRHPVADNGYPQSQQRQTQERFSVVQESQADPNRNSTENRKDYVGKWFEPITILTFALVVGVIVTNCIYYGQLNKMRETVTVIGKQRDTMEGQLTAMQGQLSTMKDQVEFAGKQIKLSAKQIDLMIENERAYIGVRNIKPLGLDGKDNLGVRITFRNGGQSPAFGFRAYAVVEVKRADEDPSEFKWIEVASPIARSFIAAKEDRNVFAYYLFGIAHDPVIISKGQSLFVDGEARYFTLGGQEVILCFGVTWNGREFEVRHQYER
jgi:hypothetical protein